MTWGEYALSEAGHVEAQAKNGPVIVWGQAKTGRRPFLDFVRDVLARLPETPTPSPLDMEAARLNTRAHFLAFVRAARGKVRASVRWKTSARVRRREIQELFRFLKNYPFYRRLEGRYLRRKHMAAHYRYLVAEKIALSEGSDEHLKEEAFRALEYFERFSRLPDQAIGMSCNTGRTILTDMNKEQWLLVIGLFPDLFSRYLRLELNNRVDLTHALRFLEAAAYRAHLARRVKPVSRRPRAPRPLYARPRPPTCPTAPPVA
ncbi:hypothetical protein [Deinococcus arcticus]|uniref:hypothetical protein n=1 Tax=Deinococcus arcticus TaxID=2136176 RepID=UPI0011B228A8|nr:hypothetical protein [Deinococcus arcticus]